MTTFINAPVALCFRLSLSIDLEAEAVARWGLRPVAGVASGVIAEGQTVTWRGRQFGLKVEHTSVIDRWRATSFFRDRMTDGFFSRFAHEHHFAPMNSGTRMRDEMQFAMPWGAAGRMVKGIAARRLVAMLQARNALIKEAAEGDRWLRYLPEKPT